MTLVYVTPQDRCALERRPVVGHASAQCYRDLGFRTSEVNIDILARGNDGCQIHIRAEIEILRHFGCRDPTHDEKRVLLRKIPAKDRK